MERTPSKGGVRDPDWLRLDRKAPDSMRRAAESDAEGPDVKREGEQERNTCFEEASRNKIFLILLQAWAWGV